MDYVKFLSLLSPQEARATASPSKKPTNGYKFQLRVLPERPFSATRNNSWQASVVERVHAQYPALQQAFTEIDTVGSQHVSKEQFEQSMT